MSEAGTADPAPATIEILRRLVGFDTVSARSNLELIRWVADYLDGHGIASRLTYDEGGNKANLFATIGPAEAGGGVILSGHTDVVPVEGQPWDSDPFALVERDGKLYARGAADMKSFIAIALALVPEFKARALKRPIHFAFSFDEEVGCNGVHHLIEDLPQGKARPRLVIIGEPTLMAVANAHKGSYVFRTTVTGLEAHSSTPQRGVNAIFAASEIIQFIAGLAAEARAAAEPESGFVPPYTSFNIGMIGGGTAHNIIARECAFTWEFRTLPGRDPEAIRRRVEEFAAQDLLPRLRQVHAGASIATEAVALVPGLVPEPQSPAVDLARQLTGANDTTVIAFGTEAGIFQAAGIPAVICGPGSIDEAHKPNEFIALEQIAAGTAFQRRLADWAAR
ncbi:MAG TPA: acetylornithine deacetylase [Stellaceae bacterium]|nr:acetylornithine deacetylase [Stellaceae bacterium]